MSTESSAPSDAPAVSEQPVLIYSWVCPYVHRVTLALAFKGASIPRIEIDLANKPSWLPKYSPHGKVPAITYVEDGEQQVLYESLALLPWVDEYFKDGPALLPASPAQRTKARIIISRLDTILVSAWYGTMRAKDVDTFREALVKVHDELTWLEGQLHPQGPFILGAEPSLVDAAIAPWLLRSDVIKYFKNVDLFSKHPKIQAYVEKLKSLPTVQSTFTSPSGTGLDSWIADMVEMSTQRNMQPLDLSAAEA